MGLITCNPRLRETEPEILIDPELDGEALELDELKGLETFACKSEYYTSKATVPLLGPGFDRASDRSTTARRGTPEIKLLTPGTLKGTMTDSAQHQEIDILQHTGIITVDLSPTEESNDDEDTPPHSM